MTFFRVRYCKFAERVISVVAAQVSHAATKRFDDFTIVFRRRLVVIKADTESRQSRRGFQCSDKLFDSESSSFLGRQSTQMQIKLVYEYEGANVALQSVHDDRQRVAKQNKEAGTKQIPTTNLPRSQIEGVIMIVAGISKWQKV